MAGARRDTARMDSRTSTWPVAPPRTRDPGIPRRAGEDHVVEGEEGRLAGSAGHVAPAIVGPRAPVETACPRARRAPC